MPGGIRVGQVESRRIQVEETGERVTLRDTLHAHTNHYIKESRPYFPNTKLPTYIDCPLFSRFARLLCFASFFGCFSNLRGVPNEISLGFSAACFVFFLIFCQHEWVSRTSLPIVLKQPVYDGEPNENNFYEVTITELRGVALENYQAGIGFVEMTQGKIKIQVFNKTAVKIMSCAKCYSRVMLVLFFVTSAYNLCLWWWPIPVPELNQIISGGRNG